MFRKITNQLMGKKSLKHRFFSRYRNNFFLSKAFDFTGRDLKPAKWIFIIGCYNSGTTLLDQILSQHKEVGGLNDEGVMLTSKLARPEDFSWRRMWVKCENLLKVNENPQQTATLIKRHWSHFYDRKKTALLEKSISNAPRAVFFNDNFQPAYFIHIVRNGYAVAEGIRRKAKLMPGNPFYPKGQYPINLCAEQWTRSLQVVREQQGQLHNFFEITYEQLTTDPDKTMQQVCRFLDISPFDTSLKSVSFSVHQTNASIQDMNQSSLERLTNDEIGLINEVAAEDLKRYGYYVQHSFDL